MDNSLSERFLNAYSVVEEFLRRSLGAENHDSFSFLVDLGAKRSAAIRSFRDDLKEFAELRNAIVHKRVGNMAIAEPHPEVVEKIEQIAEQLTSPPLLMGNFDRKVELCSPDFKLSAALELMRKGGFNQLPVYKEGRLTGLLSAEVLSSWLINQSHSAQTADLSTSVREILRYSKDWNDYAVLPKTATIYDALEAFEESYGRGRRIQAVFFTDSGSKEELPLGILTTNDIPQLMSLSMNRSSRIHRSSKKHSS